MSTNVVPHSEGNDAARPQLKSKLPSGLLRKITTKIKPPRIRPKLANLATASPPTSPNQPSTRQRSAVPVASQDLAAIKRRQAALQKCGLVPPPRRDLSQLEEELDRRFSHVVHLPQHEPEQGGLSSAERIRREWQGRNEAQPEEQDVTSDSLCPARTILELTIPDIPEEDPAAVEIEKTLPPIPPTDTVDPPSIPLPDSPPCSSVNLPELPSTPSPRESKRPPPIVINLTTIDVKENAEEPTLGSSTNRHSTHSLTTKSSLPALSPTMTTSSTSSISTPRDDESRERMDAIISPSNSGKSRSSRFGKVSDTGRDSGELGVVHETIPESPEPATTESVTQNPNRESTNTMGSACFEAFVEKREKWLSTGVLKSSRRNSGSSSKKSTSSELSFGWVGITNDFSLEPLDVGGSRSSTLPSTPASTDENKEPTPTQSQAAVIEQPRSKIARSKSVITSLGLKVSRRMARPPVSALPSPPPSPVRLPTVKIVQDRECLIQDVEGIEDDESRRLTRAAFMDF